MFIFKSCTSRHIQKARPHRLLSLCLPSAPIRHTQPYLEVRSTRSFIVASAMPKRKRAPAAPVISPLAMVVNTGVSTNASVLEEQTDECFDICDVELAEATSLDSSVLSSPPVSGQEESGGFIPEPDIAIPVSKKRAGGAKKAPVASKRKPKDEDGVEINENGAAKKTTTAKKKPQGKKKKVDENDDGMESEVEEPEERPPPVNSEYVPIPWKGRLGFVCLSIYYSLCAILTVFTGLFEHLSTVLESTNLLLPNMPNRYDTQAWHRRSEIRRVPGPSKRL